jgi:hypothetical protein
MAQLAGKAALAANTNATTDFIAKLNAEAAKRTRNEMTEMFNLQESYLQTQYTATMGKYTALINKDRLDGFRHARDMINASVTDAPQDGLALDKLLKRVRRQKNPPATTAWTDGVQNAVRTFNRIYGPEMAHARQNQPKSTATRKPRVSYDDLLKKLADMKTDDNWQELDSTHTVPVTTLGMTHTEITNADRRLVLEALRDRTMPDGRIRVAIRHVPLSEVNGFAQKDFRPEVLAWYVKEKQQHPHIKPKPWETDENGEETGAWGVPGPLLVKFTDGRSIVFDGTHRYLAAHLTRNLVEGKPAYRTHVLDLGIPSYL